MSAGPAEQPAPSDQPAPSEHQVGLRSIDLTTSALPVRVLIVVATGVGIVAVGVAHRRDPLLAVLLASVVAVYGVLSLIDAAEQRLPNRITLPLAGASAVAVLGGGVVRGDLGAGLGAIGVGVAFAAVLFVMRFGMGDVKMALSVGTVAGWLGIDAVVVTMMAGAMAGGVVALVLLVVHRRRAITFSYGPFLAVGSVVGMASSGTGL